MINLFSVFRGGKAGCRTLDAAVSMFGSEGAKCWVEIKADGMGCFGRIFINLVLFHNSVLISLSLSLSSACRDIPSITPTWPFRLSL